MIILTKGFLRGLSRTDNKGQVPQEKELKRQVSETSNDKEIKAHSYLLLKDFTSRYIKPLLESYFYFNFMYVLCSTGSFLSLLRSNTRCFSPFTVICNLYISNSPQKNCLYFKCIYVLFLL